MTTLDGIVLNWNAGAEKVFGYTPLEAIGNALEQLIVADEQLGEQNFNLSLAALSFLSFLRSVLAIPFGALIFHSVHGTMRR